MGVTFPNESTEYRKARNALLDQEIALRRNMEAVAAQRRALPAGGKIPANNCSTNVAGASMPERSKR